MTSELVLVAFGDPDDVLLSRLSEALAERLALPVRVHPSVIPLGIPDRDEVDGPQWDAEHLDEALHMLDLDAYRLGITDCDLFGRDLPFVFGYGADGTGVLSYSRFQDDLDDREDWEDVFVDRVIKQALSSFGAMLNLPDCNDASCVRAYPGDFWEHGPKRIVACTACRNAFRKTLGRDVQL